VHAVDPPIVAFGRDAADDGGRPSGTPLAPTSGGVHEATTPRRPVGRPLTLTVVRLAAFFGARASHAAGPR